MVRRRDAQGDNAEVRGPTSALTSFLRGQGIESRPRQLGRTGGAATPPQPEAGPSTPPAATVTVAPTPAATPPAAVEEEVAVPAPAAKKRKKDADDADDFALDFVGEHKGRYEDRKPGSITLCAECGKKFTVTKYTRSLPDGAGMLCLPCEKELDAGPGQDGGLGGPAPKKRRTAKPKAAPLEKVKPVLPTLQECCIKIIGQCIEDLEEDTLGDVGSANMEKICKIVCKNRSLTPQTLKLFLDISQQELRLFDCSRLDERGYETLCNLAPGLRSLSLRFCGTIDDDIMGLLQRKLVHLQHLELYGPFLVRPDKWKAYFDTLVRRDFQAFRLQQCPRFDMSCVLRLVESVPGLVNLQLADVVKLDNDGLQHLEALKHLRHLDIGRAGKDGTILTDDAVISLLGAVGAGLESLVLDLNESLTDRTLVEGILPHCRAVTHLSLRGLPKILATGVAALFKGWDENPPLRHVDLNRLIDVDDDALGAVVDHSGSSLRYLDLNSCDSVTEAGLNHLAVSAPLVEVLDVSFVRAADDFVVKALLDHMPSLRVLGVFGDNRVTDTCPRKAGVSIRGQEGQFDIVKWD